MIGYRVSPSPPEILTGERGRVIFMIGYFPVSEQNVILFPHGGLFALRLGCRPSRLPLLSMDDGSGSDCGVVLVVSPLPVISVIVFPPFQLCTPDVRMTKLPCYNQFTVKDFLHLKYSKKSFI